MYGLYKGVPHQAFDTIDQSYLKANHLNDLKNHFPDSFRVPILFVVYDV